MTDNTYLFSLVGLSFSMAGFSGEVIVPGTLLVYGILRGGMLARSMVTFMKVPTDAAAS